MATNSVAPATPTGPLLCEEKAIVSLFDHVTSEVQHRREPEYAYTAASVGAFGAVAWGVAVLGTAQTNHTPAWRHPALVGAIGVGILAVAVSAKILREHSHYAQLRREQVALADRLFSSQQLDLIAGLKVGAIGRGGGHWWSIGIVASAAFAAVAFCLSIWAR